MIELRVINLIERLEPESVPKQLMAYYTKRSEIHWMLEISLERARYSIEGCKEWEGQKP
jgi:hypothetical protein